MAIPCHFSFISACSVACVHVHACVYILIMLDSKNISSF